MNLLLLLGGLLVQLSHSQFIYKTSRAIPGATITYKKTTACNASSNTLSYSGYVRFNSAATPDLQGSTPFNTSTFFWFFPARNATGANLALYLAGGPGEASSFAALTENGPCSVQNDGATVASNPFSFNENAHVLYVDQPNQVGFSYDQIVDGVFDVFGGNAGSGAITPGAIEQENLTRIKGKFASQDPETTARTSTMAAKSMWYFLQVFFADFGVKYGEKNSVSIWGNSYGGVYVPSLASYILRTNSELPVNTTYSRIRVPSVGITNGCVDIEAQGAAYASFPYNNTYDNPDGTPFQLYSECQYNAILSTARAPGGCFDLVQRCHAAKASLDPGDAGTDPDVNEKCAAAAYTCNQNVLGPFSAAAAPRSPYDIGLQPADPNPPKYAATYLNNPRTRENLGIPAGLNYTLYSSTVFDNFFATGDAMRKGSDDLTYLLDQGTRVAMIYGDRDWRCNWVGAENLTLSLPWTPLVNRSTPFAASGYVELEVPSSSTPTGVTRQHTLLSFTRVFQAGHAVSWYAPATVQAIFNRVVKDVDVATGRSPGRSTFTTGKPDSWGWRLQLGKPQGVVECSLWSWASSCTPAQVDALGDGTAEVDATWKVVVPAK